MSNVAAITEFAKELVPDIKSLTNKINVSSPKNARTEMGIFR